MPIDVLYSGAVLARDAKMVSTPRGTFVELTAPMPVGTQLVLEEDGAACAVRVERVQEGASAGVFVTPLTKELVADEPDADGEPGSDEVGSRSADDHASPPAAAADAAGGAASDDRDAEAAPVDGAAHRTAPHVAGGPPPMAADAPTRPPVAVPVEIVDGATRRNAAPPPEPASAPVHDTQPSMPTVPWRAPDAAAPPAEPAAAAPPSANGTRAATPEPVTDPASGAHKKKGRFRKGGR